MRSVLLMGALVLGMGMTAWAGDDVNEDYTLTLDGPADVFAGGSFDVDVSFTNDGIPANGVQGGVCSDNPNISLDSVDGSSVDALDTTFSALTEDPDGDSDVNWNFGLLMNVISGATLAADGTVHDLYVATYEIADEIEDGTAEDPCDDDALDTIPLVFCDIGPVKVPTAIIAMGDQNPVREELTVCVGDRPPFGDYCLDDIAITAIEGIGEGTGELTISILAQDPYTDSETSGFQCAIAYDDTRIEAIGMSEVGELASMNDGSGAGFFGVNTVPTGGPGITVGVVYNLGGGSETIVFDEKKDVIEVELQLVPAENLTVGSSVVDFEWVDDLGDPVLPNSAVVDGSSLMIADKDDGTVTINVVSEQLRIRGDCNDDGRVDIGDAIWQLEEVNRGGPTIDCFEACDTNDDGLYDNSDAIYCLNYRFLDGPEPPAPFPDCGVTGEDPLPSCNTAPESCL